ncbi:MAG: hypothetical protein O7G85_05085 [Planctomycetota bacterium]|nr:hypothetical protein [Planctomycetota bacterium]
MSDAPSASDSAVISLWTRLRYTPLRDVMRGDVSGRLDLKGKVVSANLPESLGKKVIELVKATRLTRLERTEVADELIAHFLDGLETGASPADLANAFGDVRRAGRLIRRAKKRLRPIWWQTLAYSVKAIGLLFALGLGLYLFTAASLFLSKPSPSIDYRLQINEVAMAVPVSDRAWPVYLNALLGMPEAPSHKGNSNREPRPGEPGWEITETYLMGQAERLVQIRQAASMPGFGFLPGYELTPQEQELWPTIEFSERDIEESGMYAILLPHLSELRKLARILQSDALRAAAEGDSETTLADIEAMLGITRHLRETPFIINDLVSLSTLQLAIDTTAILLARQPELFDDRQLSDMAHRFAPFDDAMMRVRFNGERLGFLDIVQRLYTDDGSGNGHLTADGVRLLRNLMGWSFDQGTSNDVLATLLSHGPLLRTVMVDRAELVEKHDHFMDAMDNYAATPPWQRQPSKSMEQIEQWFASPYLRIKYLPLVTLMPALTRAAQQSDRVIMQRDALLTAIALELYRRRNGDWPESLAELTPGLLPESPIDRFTGEPLLYTLVDDHPLLYARGADRDDVGGQDNPLSNQWTLEKSPPPSSRPPEGDWVLWPVPVEPFLDFTKAEPVDD